MKQSWFTGFYLFPVPQADDANMNQGPTSEELRIQWTRDKYTGDHKPYDRGKLGNA